MELVINGEKVLLTSIPGPFSNYKCDVMNGRIYSFELGRWLTANPGKRFGYCKVRMVKDDGTPKVYGVHEVVMSAMMGVEVSWWRNQTPKLEVNHINEKKTDNQITNLELVTRKKNIQHSLLFKKRSTPNKLGSDLVLMIRLAYHKFEGKKSAFINEWVEKLGNKFSYSVIEDAVNYKTYANMKVTDF